MQKLDAVYALICQEYEKEVLLVKNKGRGWSFPGGTVEKGETLEQALIRETKEETGLNITVENVVAINEVFFRKKGHHVVFIIFKAKIISGEISCQDLEEITDIKWVDFQKANELMPFYPAGIEGLLESSIPYIFQSYLER